MRIILLLLLCLSTGVIRSQNDSLAPQIDSLAIVNDSLPYLSLNVNTAFIFNRAFSHFSESDISSDKFGTAEIESMGPVTQLSPGFSFGAELLMGQSPSAKLILGISVTNTSAKYYYYKSVLTRGPSVYVESENITSYNVHLKSTMLNYEAGAKIKLFKGLFVKNTLIVNQNLNRVEQRKGESTLTSWSNYPAPAENYTEKTSEEINTNGTVSATNLEFSYRLALEYDIKFKKEQVGILVFRNFGLTKYLPWWGVGFSYYLSK